MVERVLPQRFADELEGTPYRHVRGLAKGGMGEVHVVTHRVLGTEAVMKVIRARLLDDEEALTKRLIVEARSLRSMRHPNLVEVLDFGFTNAGRAFLVTELLHGRTLKEELQARGRLPLAEALDVLDQTLAGLALVHDAGVVHRDLKPDNLFYCSTKLGTKRVIKVLDFGVAKILTAEAKARAGPVVPTREGYTVGTPLYMSPEQVLARSIDARADLYGLGGVLFHLLSGSPPFVRENAALVMEAHVVAPAPRLREWVPEAPVEVEAVILKAMQKDAKDRFATVAEMRAALASLPRRQLPSKGTIPMNARLDGRSRERPAAPLAPSGARRSAADAETMFGDSPIAEPKAPPAAQKSSIPRSALPAPPLNQHAWEPGAIVRFESSPPEAATQAWTRRRRRWVSLALWIVSVLVVGTLLATLDRYFRG